MEKNTVKKKKTTVWDILFWVALVVMIGCAGVLGWKYLGYKKGQDTYKQMVQEYIVSPSTDAQKQQGVKFDFDKIQKENPDIVAWLQIESLGIDYPIMHADDNAYYLYRLPNGEYNASGSLFLDYNNESFEDLHTLVYGHNMRDGSMLAGILKYLDKSFYDENGGELILHTKEGVWQYELAAIAQVAPDSFIYTLGFSEDEQYAEFLNQVKASSVYDTGVELDEQDKVITLSTCTRDGKNRVVLSAVRTEQMAES